MDHKLGALGVDPEAGTVLGHGDLGGGVDHEVFARLFQAGDHFSDVEVKVALSADFGPIDSDTPIGTPKLLRLIDGGGPEVGALGGGHVFQFHHAAGVFAGQEEQAIRLSGIHVLEEEIGYVRGLLFGFIGKRALPRCDGLAGG